jgi:hypothetical protein
VKPKAVNGSHRRFLRLNASKYAGKQDKGITVVSIHMLDNAGCSVGKRICLSTTIFQSRNPPHYPEAAHVIDIHNVHAVEGKVFKVHPVFAVGVPLQVQHTCFRHIGLWYRYNIPQQRDSGRAEGITA